MRDQRKKATRPTKRTPEHLANIRLLACDAIVAPDVLSDDYREHLRGMFVEMQRAVAKKMRKSLSGVCDPKTVKIQWRAMTPRQRRLAQQKLSTSFEADLTPKGLRAGLLRRDARLRGPAKKANGRRAR